MSLESVQKFLTELRTNESFRTKLINTNSKEQLKVTIKTSGYNFSSEEIQTVSEEIQTIIERIPDVEKDEINEEELSEVSGGSYEDKYEKRQYQLSSLAQVGELLKGLG
ncbi:MAG: Nif11-like leader peptide family natural product precursor [Cyanobacteria bacterium P01_A01_bin.84]